MAAMKMIGGSLAKSTGIYTLANLINAAIPFLLLPVLTRYLSPFDYGIVAMFQVLLGIVGSITGLSVHGAVARQYYDREQVDFPRYIGNCFYILAASTSTVALIVWTLAGPISRLTEFPSTWLWSVVLVCAGQFVVLVFLVICQVQVKPLAYGRFQILLTLTNASLSLLFVISLGMGWEGRIQGQVMAYVIFAILAFVVLLRDGWIQWSFSKDYLRSALKFGVPLIPHAFGMWAINMTDRILITRMVGVEDTGVYVVGAQIGMIIGILQDSFNRAWVPWLYAKLKLEDSEWNQKIVKITYCYNAVILFLALALAWAAPWFLNFYVGEDFSGAGQYVLWIALGYVFNGMYKMMSGYIFYRKRTAILARITFFTALSNLVISYFLIKVNGAIGAAQGTMIAYFISLIVTWILAQKIHPMPWRKFINNS